jgi:TPR repeat protein
LVKQDFKKAVHWYTLAAKQGDIWAQRELGYCYFYGQGVKQDSLKAIYWYKKAASKNDDNACYNLGLCYKNGDGVAKSKRWARHYFIKADKFGHKMAKGQLRRLDKE